MGLVTKYLDASSSNEESEESDNDSDGTFMSCIWKDEWKNVMGIRFQIIRRRHDLDAYCEAILFTQEFNQVWADSFCFGQLRDVDNPPTGWLQVALNFIIEVESKRRVNLLKINGFFMNPDGAEEWPLLMVGPIREAGFNILSDEIKKGPFNDNEVIIYASNKQYNFLGILQ